MIRLYFINIVVFGFICGYLDSIGYSFKTLPFWIVLTGLLVVQINNSIRPSQHH